MPPHVPGATHVPGLPRAPVAQHSQDPALALQTPPVCGPASKLVSAVASRAGCGASVTATSAPPSAAAVALELLHPVAIAPRSRSVRRVFTDSFYTARPSITPSSTSSPVCVPCGGGSSSIGPPRAHGRARKDATQGGKSSAAKRCSSRSGDREPFVRLLAPRSHDPSLDRVRRSRRRRRPRIPAARRLQDRSVPHHRQPIHLDPLWRRHGLPSFGRPSLSREPFLAGPALTRRATRPGRR